MSNNLYSKKTVKSNVFLFPLLGTSRYSIFPCQRTYIICDEKKIDIHSKKLLVEYRKYEGEEWNEHERKILLGNKNFIERFKNGDNTVYVFDMSYLKDEWDKFLDGMYSKFSVEIKKRIMAYHIIIDNNVKKENRVMYEILYPENPTMTEVNGKRVDFIDAFERYARILGIDSSDFRKIGEIYSKPDMGNETLLLNKAVHL